MNGSGESNQSSEVSAARGDETLAAIKQTADNNNSTSNNTMIINNSKKEDAPKISTTAAPQNVQQPPPPMNNKYQNLQKKHPNLLLNRRNNKTYFDSGDYHMARAKQPMSAVNMDGAVGGPPAVTPSSALLLSSSDHHPSLPHNQNQHLPNTTRHISSHPAAPPSSNLSATGIPAAPVPATLATVELARHPPERRQSKLIESST